MTEDEQVETLKKAYTYSIRLLSQRDYSVYKMKQKLKERQFEMEEIEIVIDKLIEQNYLREEEYKRMRIKQLVVKGFANQYILKKLEQEHLSGTNEEIESLRAEQDLSSSDQIIRLIEKKLRYKEIPTEFQAKMKLKNKVLHFLVSKGHSLSDSCNALNNYID